MDAETAFIVWKLLDGLNNDQNVGFINYIDYDECLEVYDWINSYGQMVQEFLDEKKGIK